MPDHPSPIKKTGQGAPRSRSSTDFKNQLFDIQQKFNNRKSNSHNAIGSISSPSNPPTSAGILRDTSKPDEKSELASRRRSYHPPEIHLPPILSSDDSARKRDSLPIMSVRRKTSAQLIQNTAGSPNSNGNVDFLSDLSDGLLIESRRLNHENNQYKTKLKELEVENGSFLKQINNLTLINRKLSEKEESSNDRIWELETENDDLKQNLNKFKTDLNKSLNDNSSKDTELNKLKDRLETFKLQKIEFEKDSMNKINQLLADNKELKLRNLNLNDENDELTQKVEKLSVEKTKSSSIPDLNPLLENDDIDPNNLESFEDSSLLDPSISPVKQVNETNEVLEKETLKANLQNANKIIIKLRQSILKFKIDKEQLERQISSLERNSQDQQSRNVSSGNRSPLAKRRSKHDSPNTTAVGFSPSNRNSKIFSYYEDSREENEATDLHWENFDDSKSGRILDNTSKLMNIPKLVKSDDDDEDEDDDDVIDAREKDVLADELNELSDDLSMIGDGNTSQIEDKSIIKASVDYGLVALPNDNELSHSNASNLQFQLKNKLTEFNLIPVDKFNYQKLLDKQKVLELKNNELEAIKSEIEAKLVELESKHSELGTKHRGILSEHGELKSKNMELQTSQLEIESNRNELERTMHTLEAKNSDLESSHNEIKTKYIEIEINHNDLQKINLELESKHHELNTKHLELESNHSDLESSNVELQTIKLQLESKLDELESKHQELESTKSELELKNGSLESEIGELESKLVELETTKTEIESNYVSLEASKSELETKHSELESKHSEVEATRGELTTQNSELETTKAKLDSKLAELESKYSEIESKHNELGSKHSELEEIKSILESSHNELSIKHNELELKYVGLEKSKSELEAKHTELESKLAALASEHNDIQSKHAELELIKSEMESKHSQLETKHIELEDNITGLKTNKSELESKFIKELESTHDELELIKLDLESKLNELEANNAALEKANSQISATKVELESSKTGLQSTESELITVKSLLESKEAELSQLSGKFEKPDADYIKSKSEIHGLVAVPMVEHSSMKESLSVKEIELKSLAESLSAKELELQSAQEELETMKTELDLKHKELESIVSDLDCKHKELEFVQAQLNSPSVEFVKTKAVSHGLVTLPEDDYTSLKKSIDEKTKSLTVIETQLSDKHSEFDAIQSQLDIKLSELEAAKKDLEDKNYQLESPEAEYIREKAKSHGLVVLHSSDHDTLLTNVDTKSKEVESLKTELESKLYELKSVESSLSAKHDELEAKLQELEFTEASLSSKHEELESTKAELDSPDIEYLKSKAVSHNMSVVPSEEHEVMKSELSKLSSQLESPKKDYILSKLVNHKLVAIDADEHDKLVKEVSAKSTDVERLSKDLDSKVSEIDSLRQSLVSPTLESITKSAEKMGMVVIDQSEYQKLTAPLSKDSIIAGASALGLVAVGSTAFNAMKAAAETPSLDFLASNLNNLGHKTLPNTEYESLVSKAAVSSAVVTAAAKTSPKRMKHFEGISETPEGLKKKCSEMGLVALSKSSYDSLIVSSKRSLTTVELVERIEKVGMIALPKEDYLHLLEMIGSQGEPFNVIVSRLGESRPGSFKSSLTELKSLIDQQVKMASLYESPTAEYITLKGGELGLKVLTLQEFNKLGAKPTFSQSKQLLESEGYIVLPSSVYKDLSSLQEKVKAPSSEFVAEVASLAGLVILSKERLSDLESPDKEAVTALAKKYSMITLDADEYSSTQKSLSDVNSELETIKTELESTKSELQDMKSRFESPELDYIKEKAVVHGHAILPSNEYSTMSEELVVKQKELTDIQAEMRKASEKLVTIKSDLFTKSTKLDELEAQIEAPPPEYLKSKATALGLVAIPMVEHDSMKESLNMVQESLSSKEAELAAKHNELVKMQEEMEVRTSELEELRTSLGAKDSELEDIKSEMESPESEYFKSKVTSHGLLAIPMVEHDSMKKELDLKTKSLSLKEKELDSKHAELEKLQSEIGVKVTELESMKAELETKHTELAEFKTTMDSPDEVYVKVKAASHGLVAIPVSEHDLLKESIGQMEKTLLAKEEELTCKHSELEAIQLELDSKLTELEAIKTKLEVPDTEYLKEKAGHHGLISVPITEHESNTSLLESTKKELVTKIEDLKLAEAKLAVTADKLETIKTQVENPEAEYIKTKSEAHGLIAVPMEEYSSMKSDLDSKNDNLSEKDAKLSNVLSELEDRHAEIESLKVELEGKHTELDAVKTQLESPDPDYVKDKATLHGLVALDSTHHMALLADLDAKSKEVEQLRVDLESKLEEFKSIELSLATKHDELESKKALLESPSADYITAKAVSHNMVVIPSVDHDTMKASLEFPSADFITEKGSSLGYKVIPNDEFDKLKDRVSSPPLDLCKSVLTSAGLIAVSQTEYDSMLEQVKNPSKDRLVEFAIAHSMVPIPISEHDELKSYLTSKQVEVDQLKSNVEDKEFVSKKVRSFGMIPVNSDEYESLKTNLNSKELEVEELKQKIESPDREYLIEKASNAGLTAVPTVHHETTISSLTSPDDEFIKEKAAALGLTVLAADEFKDLSESVQTKDMTIKELETKISNLEADVPPVPVIDKSEYDNIVEASKNKDLEIIELSNTIENPSKSYVFEKLGLLGYVALKDAPKSRISVISSTGDSVYVDAVSHQSDTDGEEDNDDLFENNQGLEDRLRQKALELGYSLVPLNDLNDDLTSIEDAEITEAGMQHVAVAYNGAEGGATAADTSAITSTATAFDPEQLKVKAQLLGMEMIESVELEKLRANENIDSQRLKEIASDLGLAVIVPTQSTSSTSVSVENPVLSKETLQESASRLGLNVLSKQEVDRLKRRTMTAQDLASKAAELNLTLIPEDELSELKERELLTEEELQEQSRKKGFMCIPQTQYIATTVSRKPDIPHVVVLPSTYYNKLIRSHEWYKTKKDLIESAPTTATSNTTAMSPTIPELRDHDTKSITESIQQFKPKIGNHSPASLASPTFSLNDLARHPTHVPSLHSVNTYISSNREMIAAITQTIIGEYLFKYYRRLGPFSVLSESRHERYFWIHPYSLTLYWSQTNPVLGDPSENKIRALAIIGVESVEDNNPLPPGLYHKSIIIHSSDKSVKLTCPTRQRHNVWFNSIRYLIERSTDDLVNDDNLEDQYNESYAIDERVEIERSQSFRHSQPRASVLGSAPVGHRLISSPIPRSHTSRSLLSTIITTHRHESTSGLHNLNR